MNGLLRLAVCSLLLVAPSVPALADAVSISGSVSFDQIYLTFAPPFATGTNTGYFSEFSNGSVQYFLGTVPYSNGVPATELAFSITGGNGDVLRFYDQVNSPVRSTDGNGDLVVALNETGFYNINGGTAYAGYFDLTLNGTSASGASGNVPFLGTGALTDPPPPLPGFTDVAPEPASILFLGTGLLATAGLVRSRSRRTSQGVM